MFSSLQCTAAVFKCSAHSMVQQQYFNGQLTPVYSSSISVFSSTQIAGKGQ